MRTFGMRPHDRRSVVRISPRPSTTWWPGPWPSGRRSAIRPRAISAGQPPMSSRRTRRRRFAEKVAGYRIESVIGRGGMGVVYLAEHLRLKRKVAFKVLASEVASDERFRERF